MLNTFLYIHNSIHYIYSKLVTRNIKHSLSERNYSSCQSNKKNHVNTLKFTPIPKALVKNSIAQRL